MDAETVVDDLLYPVGAADIVAAGITFGCVRFKGHGPACRHTWGDCKQHD